MKTIIIDKKVYMIDDFDFVKMSLIVPALNLEKMRLATKCRIISKEDVEETFHHNAGKLYKVTIDVRLTNIVAYLKDGDVFSCENKDAFLSMFYDQSFWSLHRWSSRVFPCNKVALYAFGDCNNFRPKENNMNVIYYDINGKKISLLTCEDNEYGKKRYINFKGHAYSNRKF